MEMSLDCSAIAERGGYCLFVKAFIEARRLIYVLKRVRFYRFLPLDVPTAVSRIGSNASLIDKRDVERMNASAVEADLSKGNKPS